MVLQVVLADHVPVECMVLGAVSVQPTKHAEDMGLLYRYHIKQAYLLYISIA
jgi:hypothetical protein